MPIVTSANLAQAVLKLAAADALPALVSQLLIGNLVRRDYEPVNAQPGDVVSLSGLNHTEHLIALERPNHASFRLADVTKALAFPELFKAHLAPALSILSNRIECSLHAASELGEMFNTSYEKAADFCDTLFFDRGKSHSEEFFMVTDNASYSRFRQNPRFSEYYTAKEADLCAPVAGNVGKIGKCFIFRSALLSEHHRTIVFTRNSLGLVLRRVPMVTPGAAEYAAGNKLRQGKVTAVAVCVSIAHKRKSGRAHFLEFGCHGFRIAKRRRIPQN